MIAKIKQTIVNLILVILRKVADFNKKKKKKLFYFSGKKIT
jgi:hypothetical protein